MFSVWCLKTDKVIKWRIPMNANELTGYMEDKTVRIYDHNKDDWR